jgi:hypothetical protein
MSAGCIAAAGQLQLVFGPSKSTLTLYEADVPELLEGDVPELLEGDVPELLEGDSPELLAGDSPELLKAGGSKMIVMSCLNLLEVNGSERSARSFACIQYTIIHAQACRPGYLTSTALKYCFPKGSTVFMY